VTNEDIDRVQRLRILVRLTAIQFALISSNVSQLMDVSRKSENPEKIDVAIWEELQRAERYAKDLAETCNTVLTESAEERQSKELALLREGARENESE
jgi:hypothetical protein